MFQTKVVEKSKHTFGVLFENRSLCEIMWKNMVEPDRPQMTYNTAHALCVLDT
jgi:hypothetical protein